MVECETRENVMFYLREGELSVQRCNFNDSVIIY